MYDYLIFLNYNYNQLIFKLDIVYNDLKANLTANATFYKKEDMPADLFYSNSDRIAPIVVICDEGYTMSVMICFININT